MDRHIETVFSWHLNKIFRFLNDKILTIIMDKIVVCKADTIWSSQSQGGRLNLNVAVI